MSAARQSNLLEWAEHKFPIAEPRATKFHQATFLPRPPAPEPFDFARDGTPLVPGSLDDVPEWLRIPLVDSPDWMPAPAVGKK